MKKAYFGIPIVVISIIVLVWAFQEVQNDALTVGVSMWITDLEYERNFEGFKTALEEAGFVDGQNIRYVVENPHGDKTNQLRIIQSFIDQDVDLIYTLTTPGTLVAKKLTDEIPIVFSVVTFPVEAGIIDSFENSGNNLVGTSNFVSIEKQVSLIKQLVPIEKIGFVKRTAELNSDIQFKQMKDYVEQENIEITLLDSMSIDQSKIILDYAIKYVDVFYQSCDTLVQSGMEEIAIEIATSSNKPTFSCNKEGIEKGALIGNVADFANIGYIAGQKAALILQGSNPSELNSKFQTVDNIIINLKTAKKLGIEIPENLINSATIVE
ncbi:MAG: ABC transporter substrate-binding protein [Thaumarchaeota archaeon]|nr:ABC transporter substrate-binding protein [Nitrososphaerota archaeon]